MQITDAQGYSVTVWSKVFSALKDSSWEMEDLGEDDRGQLGAALLEAYRIIGNQEGVLVLLRATKRGRGMFLSPAYFMEWVSAGIPVHYSSADEPLEDWLTENDSPFDLRHLNEEGRKHLESMVFSPSEVVEDHDDISGVWVFRNPHK